jgi:hypothetical protein
MVYDFTKLLIQTEKHYFIIFFFFSVNTVAGTASTSTDFESVTNLQLNVSSTLPVCFNVTILEDLLIEGNETFSVQLSTSNPRIDIPDRSSLVYIVNDGKMSFTFFSIK